MEKFYNRNKVTDRNYKKDSKYNNNNNNNNKILNRFDSRFDARLKLIKKKEILRNDYNSVPNQYNYNYHHQYNKKQLIKKNNLSSELNDHNKSPMVIVTGLGNVKKDGDRLQIVNKPKKDHLVIADGLNTIVTLKNNQKLLKESHGHINNDDDSIISKNTIENDLKQIQIRIDNEYSNKNTSFINKKHAYSNIPGIANNDEMDIDYNYYNSVQPDLKVISRIEKEYVLDKNLTKNNGFKLMISNLHPRVTEDDVLVNFLKLFLNPLMSARKS
jgi:hypothetical protein